MLPSTYIISQNLAGNEGTITSPTKIGSIIEGTRNKNGIYVVQEFIISTLDRFTNPDYSNNKNNYNTFLQYKNKCVGVSSFNIGMSSPTKKTKRQQKRELHGTSIFWDQSQFSYVGYLDPVYQKSSLRSGGTEIGIRTTPWVILTDNKNRLFIVISVHANNNQQKRKMLLKSLFAEAKVHEKSGYIPIIAGDFNELPTELFKYVDNSMQSSWVNGEKRITHCNPKKEFFGYLDYIFVRKDIALSKVNIYGIDQINQQMSNKMNKGGHDHAVISQSFL